MCEGPLCQAVADWARETERVSMQLCEPWRNEYDESFSGRRWDQLYSLRHAKGSIRLWNEGRNTVGSR